MNAEQFAQRLIECRLLEQKQIDEVYSSFSGRNLSADDLKSQLIRREWLTNWQIKRIEDGHRRGYFYGNWKVQYLVGTGSFARVYRGVNIKTGEVKAVKVLRSRYAADQDTQERFRREAQTVMGLRHPNVVPIHEVDTEQGRTYMVMEFIEGQNLRDFVKVHGKVKLLTAINVARDVAAGLDYASQQGITHRDLKLSNVLLASTGRACLVDFGLAVIDSSMSDAQDFNPRSVDYAGLEKATGVGRDDKRSDLFFLGCILYHMLSGHPPLFETRERIKRMSSERFRNIEPITNFVKLPHRVVTFVRRSMELDPEKRIQTPAQAMKELDTIVAAIKAGDITEYGADLVEQDSELYSQQTKKRDEGVGRTLMLIDSNIDVQNQMRERLKKLGYTVLIFGDPLRAITRFDDLDVAEADPADCVIFGISSLGRTGIESLEQIASHPRLKKIPKLLMVNERQQQTLNHNGQDSQSATVVVPTKFRVIRQALRDLLGINTEDDIDDL